VSNEAITANNQIFLANQIASGAPRLKTVLGRFSSPLAQIPDVEDCFSTDGQTITTDMECFMAALDCTGSGTIVTETTSTEDPFTQTSIWNDVTINCDEDGTFTCDGSIQIEITGTTVVSCFEDYGCSSGSE